MKRTFFLGFFLYAFSLAAFAQQSLKLPEYQKTKLPNGLTVILMRQTEVPLVSFSLGIRAGAINDPAGKEGLASVTAELLRKGTKIRTSEQLSSELDFVGGNLFFGAEADYVRGQAEFLTKDVPLGVELLSDVLLNPTFPTAEVDKLLAQRIDGVKQAKDQAAAVIQTYFNAYLYGSHPYARPEEGDEKSLAAIKRADVLSFYEKNYSPQNTTIAVVGNFDPAAMMTALKTKFGGWQKKGSAATVTLPAPVSYQGKKLLLVDKPDSTQTYFLIGNIGIPRNNTDRVGIQVVNTVFGGRFTSMLNDALRVSSGLTYGARSSFTQRQVAGPFVISTYTQNKTTVQAIDMALDLLKKLHTEGLSEEQLNSAKAYIKGTFPPNIETNDQLARLLVEMDVYGLSENEINDYFAKIDALTLADVKRIIRQYYPLDNLVFTLIGKADEIREQVKKYAPHVDEKKISQVGF
ncbi:MAG TPA: pitrilysin family protein [Blastocatellia bacterium]|nr:pitrilysin family protein [Blastocatellia bacterium]